MYSLVLGCCENLSIIGNGNFTRCNINYSKVGLKSLLQEKYLHSVGVIPFICKFNCSEAYAALRIYILIILVAI